MVELFIMLPVPWYVANQEHKMKTREKKKNIDIDILI